MKSISWFPQWRYGQRLISSAQDTWGAVEVTSGTLGVELHFGSGAVQGRINLDHPWRPVTEYGMTMTGAVAFPEPEPRRASTPPVPQICLLGLGTGALAWSYHHLLPHAELIAVELRASVVEAAYTHCRLAELDRLEVRVADATEFVRLLPPQSQTIIAVDLFTHLGMAQLLDRSEFWRDLARALHPSGVICVNAWSGDLKRFKSIQSALERWVSAAGDLATVSHIGFGNMILFATPRPVKRESLLSRAQRVDELLAQAPAWRKRQRKALDRAGISFEGVTPRLERAVWS